MKIQIYKLSDVKPFPGNPRVNDQAVDAVARSIEELGFRQAIVIDPRGVIVVGHTRYKAALKLGLETVPVHVAKELTPEQITAYRIADNKTAELSGWDYELLPIELGKLQACDYDLCRHPRPADAAGELGAVSVRRGCCDPAIAQDIHCNRTVSRGMLVPDF